MEDEATDTQVKIFARDKYKENFSNNLLQMRDDATVTLPTPEPGVQGNDRINSAVPTPATDRVTVRPKNIPRRSNRLQQHVQQEIRERNLHSDRTRKFDRRPADEDDYEYEDEDGNDDDNDDDETERLRYELYDEQVRNSKLRQQLEKKREIFLGLQLKLQEARKSTTKATRQARTFQTRLDNEKKETASRIKALEAFQKRQEEKIGVLSRELAEERVKLDKLYCSAVSDLAQDVSRDVPDDMISKDISGFFNGDFLSWCADMCAKEIKSIRAAKTNLLIKRLLSGHAYYEALPEHLKFKMSLPDGSSPLVLLQSALSAELVNKFLSNAYFLARESRDFVELETQLNQGKFLHRNVTRQRYVLTVPPLAGEYTKAVHWRTETVKMLEKARPFQSVDAMRHAKAFVHQNLYLLQRTDSASLDDLADIFTRFSDLALRI